MVAVRFQMRKWRNERVALAGVAAVGGRRVAGARQLAPGSGAKRREEAGQVRAAFTRASTVWT